MNAEPQNLATGGIIREPADRARGEICTLPNPRHITCECGRDLHITINLTRADLDAAVRRVLADGMRAAATRGLG